MKKLNITISGKTNTGKSSLTYLIKEFLREKGLNVFCDVNLDFTNETDFDNKMKKKDIINILKDKNIIIKEIQTI